MKFANKNNVIYFAICILGTSVLCKGQSDPVEGRLSHKLKESRRYDFRNRYFIGDSAIMPKKGSIALSNRLYFMPSIDLSITDNIEVEVGAIPTFGSNFDIKPFLSAKYGTKLSEGWAVYGKVSRSLATENFSIFKHIIQGGATYGFPHANITFSSGLIYGNFEEDGNNYFFANICGSIDIGRRINAKFEHTYAPSLGWLTIVGVGLNYSYFLFDIGVLIPTNYELIQYDLIPFPYFGFKIPFSLNR